MAISMHLAYIGVKRKIDSLTHHNYFFNENWNEHFDQIFKTPQWPDNPISTYVVLQELMIM